VCVNDMNARVSVYMCVYFMTDECACECVCVIVCVCEVGLGILT